MSAPSLDKYLNKYTHPSIVPRLPPYLSRWLGGRSPTPVPFYIQWLDILVGSFCAILTLEAVFKHSHVFVEHNAPIIIASYGATAILAFNVCTAPLAQPRNILMGHFLSSLVGVCLQKLFGLSQAGRDNYYVGGALSVGVASVVMTMTNCVHPPSGASALMPFVDEEIRSMSWWYLPAQLVSSVLIIGVACITNNILRQYPLYWWTAYKKEKADKENIASSVSTEDGKPGHKLVIDPHGITIPENLPLTDDEWKVLNTIKIKLNQ